MVYTISNNSVLEGRAWSRLPIMTSKWKSFIQGSADFLGLNYYSSRLVAFNPPPTNKKPSWAGDMQIRRTIDNSWPRGKSTWLYSVPQGLGDILRYISKFN